MVRVFSWGVLDRTARGNPLSGCLVSKERQAPAGKCVILGGSTTAGDDASRSVVGELNDSERAIGRDEAIGENKAQTQPCVRTAWR